MKKKLITEELDNFNVHELEGDIEAAIEKLTEIKAKYDGLAALVQLGRSYTNIKLYAAIDEYDSSIKVYGDREETDVEYQRRLARSQKAKEANKKRKATRDKYLMDEYNYLQKKLKAKGLL